MFCLHGKSKYQNQQYRFENSIVNLWAVRLIESEYKHKSVISIKSLKIL